MSISVKTNFKKHAKKAARTKKKKKEGIVNKILKMRKKKTRAELIGERQAHSTELLKAIAVEYELLKHITPKREFTNQIESLHHEHALNKLSLETLGRRVSEFYMIAELDLLTDYRKDKWIYNPDLGTKERFVPLNMEEIL